MSTRRSKEASAGGWRVLAARARAAPYLTGAVSGLVAKAVAMGAQFVNLWLLLRLLSKPQFGAYVFVMALIAWITVVGTAGLERLVLYRLSRDLDAPGELTGGSLVATALIGAGLTSAVLAAAAAGLALAMGDQPSLPGVTRWLVNLAPLVVMTCLGRVFEAWFWARGQVSLSLLVPAAADAGRTAGFALALWLLPTQGGVALAVITAALLPLVLWVAIAPLRGLRNPVFVARGDVRYCMNVMLARGANEGVQRLDVLMIGLLASAAATAEYVVAGRIAAVIALGKDLLAPVLTPRLGRFSAAGSRAQAESEYAQTRFVGLASALAFAALLAAAGRPLLAVLAGDLQGSYPLLLILSAGSIINGGFGSNAAYLSITGHAGWTLIARLVLLGMLTGLHLFLIPRFGALGAAFGMASGLAAVNILMAAIIWRLDRVTTVTPGVLLVIATACVALFSAALGAIDGVAAAAGLAFALLALLAAERAIWLPLARRALSGRAR